MYGVSKFNNKRCGVCNIIIEGKSYTSENLKITFIKNRNLSCNPKNVVYIIKCTNYNKIYIGCTQMLNNRVCLHKSNIKLPENRKLYILKHSYKCSKRNFEIMPIYQTNDYSLLQIKNN